MTHVDVDIFICKAWTLTVQTDSVDGNKADG